jgi:hypothetical protein
MNFYPLTEIEKDGALLASLWFERAAILLAAISGVLWLADRQGSIYMWFFWIACGLSSISIWANFSARSGLRLWVPFLVFFSKKAANKKQQ